jgi:uncharacterized protein
MDRFRDFNELTKLSQWFPVTAILGPRQCGKTTLARQLGAAHHFDLEHPGDLAALDSPLATLEGLTGLIALDEVQRRPELFPILRVLVDTSPDRKFLLLGSASPDLLRQTSETLAGRIAYHRLGGFRLEDVGAAAWRALFLRGGFPRSFLAPDDELSVRWRDEYIATFLERDLPMLGVKAASPAMRRFWTMLAHVHGQILNQAELGRSLAWTNVAIRHHLDLLEGALVVRTLPPWHENLGKRVVKSPKVYVRDSGLLHSLLGIRDWQGLMGHPKLGACWEGFALEEILRDLGDGIRPHFWATHNGAELDLLWEENGKRYGVEFKWGDAPSTSRSMHIAIEDLALEHLWVVYPGDRAFPMTEKISALPLAKFATRLG